MKSSRLIFAALFLIALTTLMLRPKSPANKGFPTTPTPRSLSAATAPPAAVQAASTSLQSQAADPAPILAPAALSPRRVSRPFDGRVLASLNGLSAGAPVSFELLENRTASGTLRHIDQRDGEVIFVTGDLVNPEPGRFFFQKQTLPGKAGAFAGLVEFPASKTAYRVEPTGPGGTSELVEIPLSAAICMTLPRAEGLDEEEIPPLNPGEFPDYLIPDYQQGIIPLQSKPGATAVLYIDYRGGYTPTWGGIEYEKPNVSNAQIRDVWKRVAEDFMPFNINVTTDVRVFENAPENSRQRVVVTETSTAAPGAGGVAYLNSWNWTGDTPCWSFYTTGKNAAEVITHEAGHTLSLGHDGQNPNVGYYEGHGSGNVGWAPIMGVGYYQNVVQWSRGEYTGANNTQDDLALIVNNNNAVTYRIDDTGSSLATSRYLELHPGGRAYAEGVVERGGDVDAFQFTTTGGSVSLKADGVGTYGNLAIEATLANSSESIIASNNPQSSLSATITATVPAGTYTFRVKGVGRNSALNTGFSQYGSLGYYAITGTVANARIPDRFEIAENTPVGTLVGVVAPIAGNDQRTFTIRSGNNGSAFSINNLGELRVANATALNYETLAANTQFTVQYSLLVDINNLTDPSLSELNRRLVIVITDANEAPASQNLTVPVISGTRPGTVITKISSTDPDFYDAFAFSMVGQDGAGKFSVHPETGEIFVTGEINHNEQSSYALQVRITDSGSPYFMSSTSTVQVIVTPNPTPYRPGYVNQAIYTNIAGNLLSALLSSPSYPNEPAREVARPLLESESNMADNYGSVFRGYLIPPTSGNYTFFIAGDDNCELWLSTSTNPATISRAAYISGDGAAAGVRQWTKYSTQRSIPRGLAAATAYYFEVRHKEGGGGDNVAVGWTGPGFATTNVIPGLYLAPYEFNYTPQAINLTRSVRRDTFEGARVGQIQVVDANTNRPSLFEILSGNEEGLFAIDAEGWLRVANAQLLQSTPNTAYTLQIQITDAGTPPLTSTAWATLNIIEPSEISSTVIYQEVFRDIQGAAVGNLTSNAKYPGRPDALNEIDGFSTQINLAENYGARVRAYVVPPFSGSYNFYIASDDASILRMSADENPAAATTIASVSSWTDPWQWNKESGQRSALRNLVAGQRYYIEAIHKEGTGGDHLAVAWSGPNMPETNIILNAYLQPANINEPPRVPAQNLQVFKSAANGTLVGNVTAIDTPLDTLSFRIAGGNTGDTFAIDPVTGRLTVVNNAQIESGAITSFALTIEAQDSGFGGQYPLRTAQGTVSIVVQNPGAPFVWTGGAAPNGWSNPGNWAGASPANGARLIFGQPYNQLSDNDALDSVNWVQLTNSGFNIVGKAINIQSGLTNFGSNTWSVDTRLTGAQSWQSSGGSLTVNGAISNAGYNLNIVANSEFRLQKPISGIGTIVKSGNSRLLLSGKHNFSGPLTVLPASAATSSLEVNGPDDLELSNSDLILNGKMDLWNHSARVGALSGNGMIYAGQGNRILTLGINNGSGHFTGSLHDNSTGSGASLAVVKMGTGTQTLVSSNNITGTVQVQEGTLIIANSGGLGGSSRGTTVSPGATLALSNNITLSAETLVFGGIGAAGAGALRNNAGLNNWNGPLQMTGPTLIKSVGGRLTIGGAWNTAGHNVDFDVPPTGLLVVGSSIGGAGGFSKRGMGFLYLNTTNTFSGPVNIEEGTVTLNSAGALLATPKITIQSTGSLNLNSVVGYTLGVSQTLEGSGTVSGTATILGSLKPGVSSINQIVFTGSLVQNGTLEIELARSSGSLTNDLVRCSSAFKPGGKLIVKNIGSEPLGLGDSFQIVQASTFAPGTFDNIQLPELPTGLGWELADLYVNGTIRVGTDNPSSPPLITIQATLDTITISWPDGYPDYILTSQTNTLRQGIGTDWYAVPGVTTNYITVPLDSKAGSIFYRLLRQ